MTVSGLLVSIRSNIFPDIGLVVILQCWLTPISLIVSRNLVQWFRSLVEFVCSVKMISFSQSMQVRFMSPPIIYIPFFDFEYTVVRWSWSFSISSSFEFGGLYIDAIFSNFEPGSLICAHRPTISQSVSQFSKAFSLYSISSLKRMNTPPPPDFLSFRNTYVIVIGKKFRYYDVLFRV